MPEPVAAARPYGLDRCAVALAALSAALIVAGGMVAAINSATPFAHGSWLAAYLVLVGGVAQLVLGFGRLALPVPASSERLRRAQVVLWNVGSLAVAAGVLTGVAAVVTLGSAVLLVALTCFAAGARSGRDAHGLTIAYHLVLVVLAVSVIVGSALAHATPGG